MCLYPKLIQNPRYKPNKKNGGKIPPIPDNRVLYVPIPCGNCIECQKSKAMDWKVRLTEDIKTNKNSAFVTLTFSPESIYDLSYESPLKGYILENHIATKAVRLFLERWRKHHKTSLRHWLVTELGHQNTERIHLHGLIWFNKRTDMLKLEKIWSYGHTWQGNPIEHRGKIIDYQNYVNETTIGYITKYITKVDFDHKHYKPIILTSAGIGSNYIYSPRAERNKFNYENTELTYITETGHKLQLPTYFKDKLYTDEQKEILWLTLLDKQERYILGQRIDISEGIEHYLAVLQTARIKNKRLGYGTNQPDIEQKKYEHDLRIILQDTRIAKEKRKRLLQELKKEQLPQAPF